MKCDPEWWKYLFDRVYLMTDARSVCDEEVTCREVDMLESCLRLNKSSAILDLCGGHGRHSFELCRRGFGDITVIDYSEYLVELGSKKARSEGLDVGFVRADARNTGLPPNRFDAVIVMANSFGYFQDSDDDKRFVKEAHRLLACGGTLLLDLVDTEALKRDFKPLAWHEVGKDIVVCRARELRQDRVISRELVMSKVSGLIRDATYSVALYTPDSIADLLDSTGFSEITLLRDFSSHNESGDFGFLNNRLVVTARKRS